MLFKFITNYKMKQERFKYKNGLMLWNNHLCGRVALEHFSTLIDILHMKRKREGVSIKIYSVSNLLMQSPVPYQGGLTHSSVSLCCLLVQSLVLYQGGFMSHPSFLHTIVTLSTSVVSHPPLKAGLFYTKQWFLMFSTYVVH